MVQQDRILSIQFDVFLVHTKRQVLEPQSFLVILLHFDIFGRLLQVVVGPHRG